MHRRHLPIRNPCTEDFAAMRGGGARRHCDKCDKSVTDLSRMTETEATAFLARHGGQRVCVRYRIARDGRLRFVAPPPVRPSLGVFGLALAACTPHLEAGELEPPPDAPSCEDAAGYTIPCADAETQPPPAVEPSPGGDDTRDEPGEPATGQGERIDPGDLHEDGEPLELDPLDPRAPVTGQGCPLPEPDAAPDDDVLMGRVVVGDVEVPSHSRREQRLAERRWRREQRRAARRAR